MHLKHQGIYFVTTILILLCARFYHFSLSLLLIPYGFFLFSKVKHQDFIIHIILTILFITTMQFPKSTDDVMLSGKVIKASSDQVVLKHQGCKVLVYGEFEDISIHDYLKLEISYMDFLPPSNDGDFNYERYLLGQGIMQHGYVEKIIEHQKHQSFYKLLESRYQKNEKISSYAGLFILNNKDDQIKDIYEQMSVLSIVHLFALSGMHIHFLKKWIKQILQFVLDPKYLEYACIIIIGIYLFAIPFSVSFFRAYMVMTLNVLLKKYFNAFDILSFVTLGLLFVNPYYIYNISFIFSFFMYLVILFIKKSKHQSLLLALSSFPIILSIQSKFPLFSILLGFLFTPIIEVLYLILLWYGIFGGFIEFIVLAIIFVFETILQMMISLNLTIIFGKPNIFFLCSYYYLLFLIMLKASVKKPIKKLLTLQLSLILVFFCYKHYPMYTTVTMINVEQGDCFLIRQAWNKGNILIDTGGLLDRDIATETVIPYLHREGIKSLDMVFISHDDFDHCGGYDSLSKNIKIKNTIRKRQGDYKIGDLTFRFLNLPKISDDTNSMSQVISVKINTIDYLFTGDIDQDVEAQIIKYYPNLNIDILKVAHHGSKTSTSTAFINQYLPKVGLISCGYQNKFGHPHASVIDTLNHYGVDIYRVDQDQMVQIKHIGKRAYIKR